MEDMIDKRTSLVKDGKLIVDIEKIIRYHQLSKEKVLKL